MKKKVVIALLVAAAAAITVWACTGWVDIGRTDVPSRFVSPRR